MKKPKNGSRPDRSGRILTALPTAAKLRSTCAFWGGAREINRRGFIEIHPYSKGKCRGEGFKTSGNGRLGDLRGLGILDRFWRRRPSITAKIDLFDLLQDTAFSP